LYVAELYSTGTEIQKCCCQGSEGPGSSISLTQLQPRYVVSWSEF
jgi:hypothetical protein